MIPAALEIAFAPLLPWWALAVLAALGVAALAVGWWLRARGIAWRSLAVALVWLALANPSLVAERRDPRPDVVVVAVDRSPSQAIGERAAATEAALAELRERLARFSDLEVRETSVTGDLLSSAAADEGTRLFRRVAEAMTDIPRRRLAGVIAITDGQVHDAAEVAERGGLGAPFHALLTGKPGEQDRRLVVLRAPSFGLVGREFAVSLRIDDASVAAGTPVPLTIRREGQDAPPVTVPANQEHELRLRLDHGGQSVIELQAAEGPRELTLANNRAVLAINGVRDRLRVLLVSGEPHAGERTWRNLLKADPSVDLVHFTILRPPEKQDATPIRELALIAFPIRELFEVKLDEFDLIIFDRYRRRGVLPQLYLRNIVDYVQKGGALLEASGPPFASRQSMFRTPLGDILPSEPTGSVVEQGFRPTLTEIGWRHPVTGDLAGSGRPAGEGEEAQPPSWGRWFRQIDAQVLGGEVVMNGVGDKPLLVLRRVGEGRVAHLLSDQMWLWTRGFEGGGPQAELLRRLAHWLMKEPELEENVLSATSRGGRLEIARRSLRSEIAPVEVTAPSGATRTVELKPDGPGRASATIEVEEAGLYRLSDGELTRFAAVGALNPLELADVRATEEKLAPVATATAGGTFWLADGLPAIRQVRPDRPAAGRDWLGLRANRDYVVTGVLTVPLLPALILLLLAVGTLVFAWREEGR